MNIDPLSFITDLDLKSTFKEGLCSKTVCNMQFSQVLFLKVGRKYLLLLILRILLFKWLDRWIMEAMYLPLSFVNTHFGEIHF